MIQCAKCGNDTRTSHLTTPLGEVLLAGTISTDPQPIMAQVCTACGYIELYAPHPTAKSLDVAHTSESEFLNVTNGTQAPIPAA